MMYVFELKSYLLQYYSRIIDDFKNMLQIVSYKNENKSKYQYYAYTLKNYRKILFINIVQIICLLLNNHFIQQILGKDLVMITFQRQQQITPFSLNFILKPKGFKTIIKVQLSQIEIKGLLAQCKIIILKYDQQSQGIAPPSLFIKYKNINLDEISYQFSINLMLNRIQVFAYRYLQSEGITSIPKIFYAEQQQSNKLTLIMQNLSIGHKMLKRQNQLDFNKISNLFKEMAVIHSKSFSKAETLKEFFFLHEIYDLRYKCYGSEAYQQKLKKQKINLEKTFTKLPQMLKNIDPTVSPFKNQHFDIFKDIDYKQALENYVSAHLKTKNESKQKYCILQNDLRYENLFFCENDEVKIVDWQLARKGKPLWDIGRFGMLNLSQSQLKNNFLDMVEIYIKKFQSLTNYKFGKQEVYQWFIEQANLELQMLNYFSKKIFNILENGRIKENSSLVLFFYTILKIIMNFYKFAHSLLN